MEHDESILTELTQSPIILFGAKYAGGIAYDALKHNGIVPVCFCDNDVLRQGGSYYGTEIFSPDEAFSRYPDAQVYLCLMNSVNREAVKKQLTGIGFRHISEPDNLLLLFLKMRGFSDKEAVSLFDTLIKNGSDKVTYHNVAAFITSICTLKCKHCSALIPYYQKPAHFDTDEILASFKPFLDAVDGLWSFGFCGGEALLHPDIIKICEHVCNSKKIFSIRIATNSVVIPDVDYKRLAELHVALDIRDYGPLSKSLPELVKICEQNGLIYDIVNDKTEWYEVKPYQNGDKQKVASQRDCFFGLNCFLLLQDAFYPCGYQGYSHLLDANYELFKSDYVKLVGNCNIREELFALKKCDGLKACTRCGVDPNHMVSIAVQVPDGWRANHEDKPAD